LSAPRGKVRESAKKARPLRSAKLNRDYGFLCIERCDLLRPTLQLIRPQYLLIDQADEQFFHGSATESVDHLLRRLDCEIALGVYSLSPPGSAESC
jgi:hypothetical protein